jgi:hypothetical protein
MNTDPDRQSLDADPALTGSGSTTLVRGEWTGGGGVV